MKKRAQTRQQGICKAGHDRRGEPPRRPPDFFRKFIADDFAEDHDGQKGRRNSHKPSRQRKHSASLLLEKRGKYHQGKKTVSDRRNRCQHLDDGLRKLAERKRQDVAEANGRQRAQRHGQ